MTYDFFREWGMDRPPAGLSGFSTAGEMLAALRARQISALELLELHQARCARYNSRINALVIPNEEQARAAARAADEARARGDQRPLLGLPFTVKDWIETEGLPGTAGDLSLKDYRAGSDCRVVARIRAAGANLMAKTNMAPWGGDYQAANPVFGRSSNPWDLERTPGGSTGGGAAALAAGLTPLEFGNDIGGSVRTPAAFCGVYGHKPSENIFPRSGQTPDRDGRHLPNPATGLAMIGPMARCAQDLALAVSLASGPDQGEEIAWRLALPAARHARLKDFRVAVLPRLAWLPVDEQVWAAQERLVGELARRGVRVAEAAPQGYGDGIAFHQLYHMLMILQTSLGIPPEARQEIYEWGQRTARERNDPIMEAGARAFVATAVDYIRFWGQREQYRAAYRDFFKEWDVLLTPTAIVPAFRHADQPAESDVDERWFTIGGQQVPYLRLSVYPGLATLCGQPATAFPYGLTAEGLPVGLQVTGPYLEDYTPLRFAALVGEELGGFQAPPGYE